VTTVVAKSEGEFDRAVFDDPNAGTKDAAGAVVTSAE
jgi:hypothetical protein